MRLVVVSDYQRARAFDLEVLGAKLTREFPDSLAFLDIEGAKIVLSVPGGPTADKPTVTFAPPTDPGRVSSQLIFRVRDCEATYRVLRHRGATFLTPPVDHGYEVRAFLRDPDGHLIEISQRGPSAS